MYVNNYILFSAFIIFSFTNLLIAQQDTIYSADYILEQILDESIIEKEDSQLYDLIEQLHENPININTANSSDLMIIPLMNITIANKIIEHRNVNGDFFSVNELNDVKGISRDMINLIKQFITVRTAAPEKIEERTRKSKTYLLKFRTRIINDIQTRRGFSENIYSGSRTKMYNRIKYQPTSNIKFGGLIEKDAGETLYWDFYSLHLQIKDLGFINNVILGDYTLEFGQGLAMWSPYSFSKSSNAIHPIIKRDRNLSPYTSTGEYNFLRGISLSMNIGKIIFTPFYSAIRYDATFIDSTNLFSSFNISGYHRTNNEINKKNNIRETVFGGRIDYNVMSSLDISFLYFNTSFSNSLEPKTVHDAKGNRFDYYSLSYKTSIKNLFITGEFSFNSTALASINTIQLALSKDFIFVASIRNYPENYFSFYSNGFGETSITRNEFGIYTGFKWKISFGIFNFYIDQFKFPNATFDNPLPSTGDELMISYSVKPLRSTHIFIRYLNERKEITELVGEQNQIIDRRTQKVRGDVSISITKNIRVKSRVELVFVKRKETNFNETGLLLFQDIQIKPIKNFTAYARIIFFQTDSYASRIYEFENDLIGVMSNPSLFGSGIRWYLVMRYSFLSSFTLSFKYSELYKPNETELGTGYSQIMGNLDNRISLQLDFNY